MEILKSNNMDRCMNSTAFFPHFMAGTTFCHNFYGFTTSNASELDGIAVPRHYECSIFIRHLFGSGSKSSRSPMKSLAESIFCPRDWISMDIKILTSRCCTRKAWVRSERVCETHIWEAHLGGLLQKFQVGLGEIRHYVWRHGNLEIWPS